MQMVVADILDTAGLATIRDALSKATFSDGRRTAGQAAATVKNNLQAHGTPLEPVRDFVRDALLRSDLVRLATWPKTIIGPTFSRYSTGQSYGRHVDEPIMSGQRTDIAFTLFLSDTATYDGGELIIETHAGHDAVKLAAGHLVLYPATTLHRVAPITRGERLAAVGWIRSLIRSDEQRALLFDLSMVHRELMAATGARKEADLVAKSIANLTRMWCDD
jgi:PKHD-type hydroxylase